MAYRNKTYVAFASEDIHFYRLMQAWKANTNIDFDFYDAHDLNTARDTSLINTIERRLTERLQNTKQVVLLVGDQTKAKAGDGVSFLHHECKVISRLELPVVFANLNASRQVQSERLPALLRDLYSVCVSFQPGIIKYALDNYVDSYSTYARTKRGPHLYKPEIYARLGL